MGRTRPFIAALVELRLDQRAERLGHLLGRTTNIGRGLALLPTMSDLPGVIA